jgi:RHS repeat-associated protein
VRGWLTSINKSYTDTYNSAANYFGEDIFYDYGFTNSQVNGSIAGVKWKAAGDTIARAYGFTYDNANRVTKADFSQNVRNTTTWNNATTDFSVSNITYDGGGNLLSMSQKGLTIGSSVTIDSLKYQYYSNSNQLQKVTDAAPYTSVGLGDFRDTALAADDYAYDVNGNIIKDYNRKMNTPSNGNGAKYNLLDKPDSLVISGKGTFYYIYDAAGNTLRKQVEDYITGTTKTYLYLDGFVYFNDTLQYVQTEEGRIRWANKRNSTTGASYYAFEYDYYLRDHLGNVRTVLTEGRDTATYAATMESSDSAVVRALFSNVYDPVRTVSAKPANFDTDNNNHNVSLLTGNTGGRMGPAMILKVMAGDKVQISTFAFYNTTTQPPVTDNTLVNDLLATLVSGVTVESGGKLAGRSTTDIGNVLSPVILSALNTRAYNSSLPKAYLNWILLDDQFKYVAGNMGAMQVMAGSSKQALAPPLQTMAKNGYLYVFVSNQSTQNVYFDDLVIKHYTGPLLQEQSYYPFGLQMAGISDEAMNKLTSRNKFNGGTELEEDYGVNLYSTFYRQYDPQIGRFSGVDALAEQAIGLSAYQFGNNNPLSFNDPSGLQSRYGGESERYMDRWGNIWHTPGVLHGISSLESVPYSYEDEFYIMTQRNSGGQNGGGWGEATVKAGYNNGQAGFWVGKSIPGEGANGETLAEAKVTREFFSLNYGESNSAGGVELAVHFNDALGGFGTGLGYSSASFRLTNGTYNGSEFSFKYYSSGWEGGSRARISTYEVAGFGEGLAKGSFIAGVVLGGITVYQGIEKDGETYGSNAQLATGNAVGGLVGGWAGAETGAAIGASVGVWFFGAGAVPGAIIGGIIGGVIGGMAGGEAGEDVVRDIRN